MEKSIYYIYIYISIFIFILYIYIYICLHIDIYILSLDRFSNQPQHPHPAGVVDERNMEDSLKCTTENDRVRVIHNGATNDRSEVINQL